MKRSIKFRILSRLAILISIVLLILSCSMLFIIQQILSFSLESRSKDDLQLLSYLVNDMAADATQTSKLLSVNEHVQNLLSRSPEESASAEILAVRTLMSKIEKGVLFQNYVQSFCIVTPEHKSYWNSSPNSSDFYDWFEENVLLEQPIEEFRGFTNCYTFPVTVNNSSPIQLVSFVCPVTAIRHNSNTTIGYIIINLNFSQLISRLQKQSTLFNQIAILGSDQELMYLSTGDSDAFTDTFSVLSDHSENIQQYHGELFCKNFLTSTNWYIITTVDMGQAYHFLQPSYVLLGLLIIFIIVFCILLALYPPLNTITTQIQTLSQAIDQVRTGQLDTTVHLTGSNELQNISDGFNLMTVSIKQHIEKSIEENQRSQQLSFELLLAKINPHFIYNTLNSIIYLARKEKCNDIIQMTGAFIYLLQDSIHLGHSPLFARFENETEVIRQYIVIQSYRYRDRFSFHLSLDNELLTCYIPRNILQPLVENSLIHGICTNDKPGTIILDIKKEADHCVILLTDDGIGMEQSYADQLLHSQTDTDAVRRARIRPIGINNIAERLIYLFGDQHSFTIESHPGNGTKITIKIPIVTNPDSYHVSFPVNS